MVEKLFWGRSECDWQGIAVEDVMFEKLFGVEANFIGRVLRSKMYCLRRCFGVEATLIGKVLLSQM